MWRRKIGRESKLLLFHPYVSWSIFSRPFRLFLRLQYLSVGPEEGWTHVRKWYWNKRMKRKKRCSQLRLLRTPSGPRVSVRSSRNLVQSNVCNSFFFQGFSCCPYYRGVRNSEVSARRVLTVILETAEVFSFWSIFLLDTPGCCDRGRGLTVAIDQILVFGSYINWS